MQYTMNSSGTMAEHLKILSDIRDLKAVDKDISEREQVLNVIRALPDKLEHWNHVKVVLTHADHLKTFVEIQSHLEMEEEHINMLGLLMWLFLPTEIGLEVT